MSEATCSIEGCNKPRHARGWCGGHYQRWRVTGDLRPETPFRLLGAPPDVMFWTQVNRDGPIPSHDPALGRCYVWTGAVGHFGHGSLFYETYGERVAHRWAYRASYGPIPVGLCVLHRCDNPPCVRDTHLFLGTRRDNVADRTAKGRGSHGENHHSARLSSADVAEIRRRYALGGVTYRELAEEYGSKEGYIGALVRRLWRRDG